MTPNPALGVWLYEPSLTLAIIATLLYLIPTAWHFFLTVYRYRSWYFIWVFIGAALEAAGYASRIASTRSYDDVGSFAIQGTFIILAPLFVAAGNYLLISRLIRAVLPPSQRAIFGIKPSWLTEIFVIFDIVTFLIQAGASAILVSGIKDGSSSVQTGSNILIGGLSLQVITFGAFVILTLKFHSQVISLGKSDSHAGWMKILISIYISSACILMRTVYRLVEYSLGIDGYPFNHEWIFYVFESLPMLPAVSVFCLFHPGKYLPNESSSPQDSVQLESQSSK